MYKNQELDETALRNEWQIEAEGVKTIEEFVVFYNKLVAFEHDYGTVCHAMSSLGIAAMNVFNRSKTGGISGFQAGCVMWGVIREWMYKSNKLGLCVLNYDDLLYPQYRHKFNNTLSQDQADALKLEAKVKLEAGGAAKEVIEHWKFLAEGNLPFGFKIEEED